MEKKFLIPVILGVMLLCGIVFTIVYKKTDGDVGKEQPVIETLAPKETKEVETRVSTDNKGVEDFEVNEAIKETEIQVGIKEEDIIDDYEGYEESMNMESEESSIEETYSLSDEQQVMATSEVSEEINQGVEGGIREYTRKQAEDWYNEVLEANGGEIPWEN